MTPAWFCEDIFTLYNTETIRGNIFVPLFGVPRLQSFAWSSFLLVVMVDRSEFLQRFSFGLWNKEGREDTIDYEKSEDFYDMI